MPPPDACQVGARVRAGRCAVVELVVFGPEPDHGSTRPPIAAGLTPRRRYLGNEFCEHLLPPTRAFVDAIRTSCARGEAARVVSHWRAVWLSRRSPGPAADDLAVLECLVEAGHPLTGSG